MYDIVIIGSGPAGLSAAIYAQRENLKAVVVEKEFMGTGQIAESERVDNYPGLYGETGFDLGEKFRTHAEKLGAEFVEGEVTEVERVNGNFSVNIDGGESIETKTVIYAAGTQRRKLGVKGEKEFSGNGVSYCAVCDAAFYKDKITVVTGGGDTALGDALLLSRFCKKVYLVHRRDSFRAGRALQNRVFATENIEALTNATVSEINGDTKVTSVTLLQNSLIATVFSLQSEVFPIQNLLQILSKPTRTVTLLPMKAEKPLQTVFLQAVTSEQKHFVRSLQPCRTVQTV